MTKEVALLLFVCLTAILAFFSQEFYRTFKKIFALRGAKLILPLAFASWFVYFGDDIVLSSLYYVRDVLNNMVALFLYIMPNTRYTSGLVLIFILSLFSIGPVALLHYLSYRKTHKPYAHPYLVSTLLWIIGAALLVALPGLYS